MLRAEAVSDDQIRATIVRTRGARGHVVCPHTACARGEQGDWAAVATAHPAKVPEVVEPLLGESVPLPPSLAAMLARPRAAEPLADDTEALRNALRIGH